MTEVHNRNEKKEKKHTDFSKYIPVVLQPHIKSKLKPLENNK